MSVTDIINVHLDSKDARLIDGIWRFRLHDPISLVGKNGTISLISFQAVNSIYNITDSNNTLNGFTFPDGFYKDGDMLTLLKTGLDPSITASFNRNSLKFKFKSDSPFTLTGSILTYVNINEPVAIFDAPTQQYITQSYRCFDVYQRAHSVNVILPNVRTSNNFQIENSAHHHLSTRIGKFNIECEFGEYITYNSYTIDSNKSILNEDTIARIDVMLKNDLNENIFINDDFTLTLRIEVITLDEATTDDGYLDSNQIDQGGVKTIGGNIYNYPIINTVVSILKTSKDIMGGKLYRKEYLKSQGLKDEDVDAIELKLKELLKKIRKN